MVDNIVDFNKPVQTRNGHKVEIKFTDGRGPFPVHGYVGNSTGITCWKYNGKFLKTEEDCTQDLVNVKTKRYINLYREGNNISIGHYWTTLEEASKWHDVGGGYLKTVEVEWD
jgi:hypothetical protein